MMKSKVQAPRLKRVGVARFTFPGWAWSKVVALFLLLVYLVLIIFIPAPRIPSTTSTSSDSPRTAGIGGPTSTTADIYKNDDWQTWSRKKAKEKLKCRELQRELKRNGESQRLPSMEYWQAMRNAYIQEVDPTHVFDDPILPTEGYTLNESGTQPFYAALSPGKGRGLFASRDIKKGELVHDGAKADVSFPDGDSMRKFLHALPTREAACDVLQWAWTQQYEKNGPMMLLLEINIAILMNEGNTDEEVNVLPKNKYSSKFYATRNIAKDEEILYDYSVYSTRWDKVGW